jgi:hypothetical protein
MRAVRTGALLALLACGLSGCLFNTPKNATKRFVSAISRLKWDKMEALVDWDSSEKALGRSLESNRKDVLLKVAETVSDYDISYEGEERSLNQLIYLRVSKARVTDETDDRATVEVKVTMGQEKSQELEFTTAKVGRTWRVVLTPNILNAR